MYLFTKYVCIWQSYRFNLDFLRKNAHYLRIWANITPNNWLNSQKKRALRYIAIGLEAMTISESPIELAKNQMSESAGADDLSLHFSGSTVGHANDLYTSTCCTADFTVKVINSVDCYFPVDVVVIYARS